MGERTLIVAPSWVGDAILSEPLVALLREPYAEPAVDVFAPAWCAPVYKRMRGIGRVIDNPFEHGRFDLAGRRRVARELALQRYARAIVLPQSWKSALVPWLARIPQRVGYVGEGRYGLLTDARPLDRKAMPRLVERFAALAASRGALIPMPAAPVLVPDLANRAAAVRDLKLEPREPIAILCPGAEYGPAKRWPPTHFADLARRFLERGMQVWLLGSPSDALAAGAVVAAAGDSARRIVDLVGKTDLGTAIDLMSLGSLAVSNDSGLMHAAAAVGIPLVALFGSSSPVYTPPLSESARIARIDIACSPCFKRECPLGHFRCMRELSPDSVYNLARSVLPF
ncbi:MAG: lipopolysaccharide heptosyltransferase II [Proteobacteria bacterium]|nr:lipopolysaccharide heptosyltransferase II [Pseudomonadota bacterium]